MEEQFFNTGFRFDKYITQRLLEISDEGERRALKELTKSTLIPFYEHTEAAYQELRERLTTAKNNHTNRYEIITGVEKRNQIDVTEEAMVPMQQADLQEVLVDVAQMQETLQQGKPYTVMKVFFAISYGEIQRMERQKRVFRAILHTENGEYPAQILLKRNTSYQEQIAELYQVFEANGLEWKTVCAPYLGKYFDVQIAKTDCLAEHIMKIVVDFEEYADKGIYNLVPMWNIRRMEERTSAYPDFALDKIHYEHCIFKNRFREDRDYLVKADGVKLWEIFQQNEDLHIVCDSDQPINWKLMELGYDAWKQKYDMPIFGNACGTQTAHRCIHTIAEVTRYVKELGYENYVELLAIKRVEEAPKVKGTYLMDRFLEDEIRISKHREGMIFTFRAREPQHYLNQDIMSYLISRIQWELPEFECIGELE